jgi:hypothetical protein
MKERRIIISLPGEDYKLLKKSDEFLIRKFIRMIIHGNKVKLKGGRKK